MIARTEFVTNDKGKRVAVLLDVKSYSHLIEAAEELADIRAYDKAKPLVTAELMRGQFITLSQHHKKKIAVAR